MLHKAQFLATLIYLQFRKYNRSLELAMIEDSKFWDVANTKSSVEICTIVTINYRFKSGCKPLTYAAVHGHAAVMRMLVEVSVKLGSTWTGQNAALQDGPMEI